VERTSLTLAPEKLVEELQVMLGDSDPSGVVLAFDGDGTLWSGDVGEDLFRAATRDSFLLEAALPALIDEAQRYQVPLGPAEADANGVARALLASYLAGQYPERETCAMMTWCYAGRRLREVEALAALVLAHEDLKSRLTHELAPIVEWSRAAGVRLRATRCRSRHTGRHERHRRAAHGRAGAVRRTQIDGRPGTFRGRPLALRVRRQRVRHRHAAHGRAGRGRATQTEAGERAGSARA
jgi:hypothetical protein